MPLHPNFPTDPYVILDPEIRWVPGDPNVDLDILRGFLPPLVHKVRHGVKAWRDNGYEGASYTTKALLNHWFKSEHILPMADGTTRQFRWYFGQREAVESAIWLFEVEKAHDPISLIRYDSSGAVSSGMFEENWTRYMMKLATGSGKTKVMSLLLAWAYFHKLYEADSELSTNFLITAPNIIVLDRLRTDFDGLRIFYEDPILPENGYEGKNWRDDFQISLHIQDEISGISPTGNIFLTNVHRISFNEKEPTIESEDALDYFVGRRPTGATNESRMDLGKVLREISDLVIINDEAHHFHSEEQAGFQSIRDISDRLKIKGGRLSAQFDVSATPKHSNGAIFVQTISDYPLVEAIRQRVVKTPVLPDEASRAKLQERKSSEYCEQYRDYLHLGYHEWKKVCDELIKYGRKSLLFIMTDDTKNCDEVAEYLENTFPDLKDAVLVIHTKNNGEISESSTGKPKEELDRLREQSKVIDSNDSPYKAIVSVMVLREGWDVQSVVSIVGLRPYSAKAKILPEQTLGRGLRRMFRGQDIVEKVSVIGTHAFIQFVESIKVEGVEFEYAPMGGGSAPRSPLVIEVDRENAKKDIEKLDINLPLLTPRIYREYKNLSNIDIDALKFKPVELKQFSEQERREIVFKDIDREDISHVTVLDTDAEPNYQSVVSYFTTSIMRDLRLVGGADILFEKVLQFIEQRLFGKSVKLDDTNTLRNLSEPEVSATLRETFKKAINDLTVQDKGTTEIKDRIRLSKTRPFVVNNQPYLTPKRSIFNKIIGDSDLELDFASFLDGCEDIVSFIKNSQSTNFKIEYRAADGAISNYYPDFIVKQDPKTIWIIETKGREDLDDPEKYARLVQWCEDATRFDKGTTYHSLFVRQEKWEEHRPADFKQLLRVFSSGG